MNELGLLETHGPSPETLQPQVLQRARAALHEEVRNAGASEASDSRRRSAGRGRRGLPRRWVALAAAGVAAAMVVAVPLALGTSAPQAMALAPVGEATFPLTPRKVPADLGRPVFEKDLGGELAVYGSTRIGAASGADRITVAVPKDDGFWDIPAVTHQVDVAGREGKLFEQTDPADHAVVLVWQQADGGWVGVTGRGRYADAARVESFAENLEDKPQPVRLMLTLAPKGWSLARYKNNTVASYAAGGDMNARDTLDVVRLDALSADFAGAYGARDVTRTTVKGRPATVGRNGENWIVEARTTQGQAYAVLAPLNLTREQVIQVAGSVRYTP